MVTKGMMSHSFFMDVKHQPRLTCLRSQLTESEQQQLNSDSQIDLIRPPQTVVVAHNKQPLVNGNYLVLVTILPFWLTYSITVGKE